LEMRTRLRANDKFIKICELLETDSEELCNLSLLDRDNFIGLFEELYLLWNSEVFRDEVVYYLFGYFAIRCWKSKNFWSDLNRHAPTWGHFRDMVERLEKIEKNYQPHRSAFRL
jgi:predicted helicase